MQSNVVKPLADFLQQSRREIIALLNEQPRVFKPAESSRIAEAWLDNQILFLRGEPGRMLEWIASLVDAVRKDHDSISDVLAVVRDARKRLAAFLLGRVPGVADADLYRIMFDMEDLLVQNIGDLYSDAERRTRTAAQRRLKARIDAMDCAFAELDGEGRITLANHLFLDWAGLTEESAADMDFPALCDKNSAAELRRELRRKVGTSPQDFPGALSVHEKSVPVKFTVTPLFDESGIRCGVSVRLTRENPNNDTAIGSSQAKRIEALLTALDMGFYLVDRDLRVVEANAAAAPFVEVGAPDQGAHCCESNRDANGNCSDCFRGRIFETGMPYVGKVHYRMVSGETRWVQITAFPLRADDGTVSHVAKVVRDFTEEKQIEDQFLQQQQTSLASQLAIAVAHQLRNPLGVVIGYAEMLSQGMPTDRIPGAVDKILRHGVRCKEIVEDLLEFGRSSPGEHVLVDVNQVILERIQPLFPKSVARRIAWRLAETLPPVECSPQQLGQVFVNLLDNGLWAASQQVVFETALKNDRVCVSVWDDGAGVPADLRERIFEPFFTTRKDQGHVGLGLSLSRSVAAEHRGRLILDATASPGACFVMELPVGEAHGAADFPDLIGESTMRDRRRILIVEDEADLLDLLATSLESQGHHVDSASTGAEAMNLLQMGGYDAIIMDIVLAGGIGGRDLYQFMAGAFPKQTARTLFITADTMSYETRQFLDRVKRPFMEKPFLISAFKAKVEELMAVVVGDGQA